MFNLASKITQHLGSSKKQNNLVLTFGMAIFLTSSVAAESLLIKNVQIISGENPQVSEPMNVYIQQNIISYIGQDETIADHEINASGKYLIPGLIDTHVHLAGIPGLKDEDSLSKETVTKIKAQIPKSYLYFGFTTLLDLASEHDFIQQWNDPEYAPEAYYCSAVFIPNGYPLAWLDKDQQFAHPNADYMLFDPRQSTIFPSNFKQDQHTPSVIAQRIKASGAKCVKMFFETGFGALKNLPVPTIEMVNNMVAAAHALNMPVYLHGNSQQAYEFAQQTDIDTLVHGMWHWSTLKSASDKDINSFVKKFSATGIAVQPTMQVLAGEYELFNPDFFTQDNVKHAIPQELIAWYQTAAGQWMRTVMNEQFPPSVSDNAKHYQNIKDAYQQPIENNNRMTRQLQPHKVRLLFGSDTPSGPFYTQFPGVNGRLEMDRWIEAGLPLSVLFSSLTSNNAQALGMQDSIGTVAVGKKANLLLLEDNPLVSVKAYDSIVQVILNGNVITREKLSAQ